MVRSERFGSAFLFNDTVSFIWMVWFFEKIICSTLTAIDNELAYQRITYLHY